MAIFHSYVKLPEGTNPPVLFSPARGGSSPQDLRSLRSKICQALRLAAAREVGSLRWRVTQAFQQRKGWGYIIHILFIYKYICLYIYPASRKVKFYEVFCKRPSFTRSSGLLGFIELSPFSHQCWIWLEPHLKLLMHDWEAFNHLQIIAPNGPFQVAMNSH